MKTKILIIILFIISNKIYATIQSPDLLIIENDTIELREMNKYPLELLNLMYRPFNYSRQTAPSTACWRGYNAIWRVIGNEVYLEQIQRCSSDEKEGRFENLKDFFNKNQISVKEKNGMILADWISINLYELKDFFSSLKGKKIVLSDYWFGKNNSESPEYALKINNGIIENNKLNKNYR